MPPDPHRQPAGVTAAPAPGPPASFGEQVRDALRHLHDRPRLQTHPLARLLGPEPGRDQPGRGKKLQDELLAAIQALRPERQRPVGRSYALLALRYVEALEAGEVQRRLAVSRSEYYLEHQRALDAVASLLWERWRPAGLTEPAPGGGGDERVAPLAAAEAARRDNLPAPLTSFVGRVAEVAAVTGLLGTARLVTLVGGGFSLGAAEAICGTEPIESDGTLDALTGLVDKSLALSEQTADGTRYRLLETIRRYAAQKLVGAGEAVATRDRLRDWYAAWSEAAAPELSGPRQQAWLDRIELEHDNLRAALAWSLATREGSQAALDLAGALWRFWFLRGYLGEGSAWLEKALAAGDGSVAARAKALVGAAFLADFRGDYRQAAILGERALPLARGAGDGWLTALALAILGDFSSFEQRDHARAAELYEQALTLARRVGDGWLIAYALAEAAELARVRYDHERATALSTEGLALARAIGDRWLEAFLLFRLGSALAALGDYPPARRAHEEALAIRRELGDRLGVAYALLGLGEVTRRQGDYGAAEAYLEERLQAERALLNQTGVAHALNHLGLLAFESGDHARARALFGESLDLCRALNYRWGTSHQLRGLGEVATAEGDLTRARALLEESLALSRELGYKQDIARTLDALGCVADRQGSLEEARALHAEGLRLCLELDDRTNAASCLDGLASVAHRSGEAVRAARLFAVAEALREALRAAVPPARRAERAREVDQLRARLGEAAFAAACAEGRAMTLEQAVAFALGGDADP